MRKKMLTVIACVAVLIFGFSLKIYGITDLQESDFVNVNEPENSLRIAEKVLTDVGRLQYIKPEDVKDIKVYSGDFNGNGNDDKVVFIDFGPKLTIAAAYFKDGDTYKYAGELGPFYDVAGVDIKKIPSTGKDAIAVRELYDHRLGSYEKNETIKAYLWDNNDFRIIINIPAAIKADWNSRWDEKEPLWNRVTLNSNIKWNDTVPPTVSTREDHEYLTSTDTENKNVPADSTYVSKAKRTIEQTYTWSDKYKAFILSEMKDTATGKNVGVLEDFKNSPYFLAPEFASTLDGYRVIDDGGTVQVKKSGELTEATPTVRNTSEIIDV